MNFDEVNPYANSVVDESRTMDCQEFRITVSPIRSDSAWLLFSVLCRPRSLLKTGLAFSVLAAVAICAQWGFHNDLEYTLGLIVLSAIYGVCLTACWLIFVPLLSLFIGNTGLKLGETEIRLNQDGVRDTSNVGEIMLRWRGIHAVRATRSYLYFQAVNGLWFLIPRRSLRDNEEFTLITEQAKLWWESRKASGDTV